MTPPSILALGAKSFLVAAIALLVLRLLRRRSAGDRSTVAGAGILALAMLPLTQLALPRLPVVATGSIERLLVEATPMRSDAVIGPAAVAAPAGFAWETMLTAAYWGVAALFLCGFVAGLLRLRRIVARAQILTAPKWLSALARAQQRIGLKQGTALLVSDDLCSPISWGVMRPTIVLNRDALAQHERAASIIAHELAHVARLDWAVLLLGRVIQCLYWFNPLVWILTREALHLAEEAADDAALRAGPNHADYADLLLSTVRHAHNAALLPAQGVAPGRSSLSRRIAHVLDAARSRAPARRAWVATCLLVAAAAASATGMVASAGMRDTYRVTASKGPGPVRYDREASRQVEILLADPSPETRARAARALGDFGTAESVAPVARLLDDPSPTVRLAAAHALGDLASPAAEPALRRALADGEPAVRAKARWALEESIEGRVPRPGG